MFNKWTRSSYIPIPTHSPSQPGDSTRPPRSGKRKLFRPTFRLIILLFILTPVVVLFTLSLLTYLLRGTSRPCLPFSLSRLSAPAHNKLSCQSLQTFSSSTQDMVDSKVGQSSMVDDSAEGRGRLADFLQSQKEAFLADLERERLNGWTIAMGNEAGDLDSLASSISLAYLSNTLNGSRTIPLILTPSNLMHLRPENQLALQRSFIPPSTLLHVNHLPKSPSSLIGLGAKFALVDHNTLLPPFRPTSGQVEQEIDDSVDVIIDHHEDEHHHLKASIREITVPTGSCASLVTRHFQPQWSRIVSSPAGLQGSPIPPEMATLLLSAIMIDTAGLKAGGKATSSDYEASAFLYPISTPATPPQSDISLTATDATSGLQQNTNSGITAQTLGTSIPISMTSLTGELQEAKFNVSALSTPDLLVRDYKQYTLPTASSTFPNLEVGLSTVPLSLKKWLDKDGGWESFLEKCDAFMLEKGLDVEGILTSYNDKTGKHKRQIVLLVRSGKALADMEAVKRVMSELESGMEASSVLQLQSWEKGIKLFGSGAQLDSATRVGKVWKQGNAKATRKQVAPILRELIAKGQ